MDKEWMRAPRFSSEHDKGLTEFIELAFATSAEQNRILCPCKKCGNNYWIDAQDIRDHLIGDDIDQMLMEGLGMYDTGGLEANEESDDELDVDAEAYYKLEEIKKRFEEDPSLISEEAHDKDLYSTLFPKERSGRRHGLGLLVGGVASPRVFEALADVQEVRHENKKLWSVVEKLMSNQTKLQQQYDELKSQVSAPQRCPSVESSPRINVSPEGYQKVTNKENKDDSVSSPKQEEPKSVVLPTLKSTKSRMSQQQKEKDKERVQTLPEKDNKQRKFQTPLHITTKDMEEDIKCGMEVGLTSPNSKMMVALGTIQTTDRKAKAGDDYAGAGLKTSKLKTEVNNKCHDVSGTSQNAVVKGRSSRLREGHHPSSLKESGNNHTRPKARQACSKVKGRSSSQFTEDETGNYHISTS
ncbi:hypothetical protein EJB05_40546 [Eragrostis curvula]|uniref:Transposase-associated domain-containing protein n=1 Tax=Eragrostis curvula TaxID=38414 RepID=A0A5J9TQI6_9POAL|nr:hypothetical protein EJB05_40546 [Eragrostis curvula]